MKYEFHVGDYVETKGGATGYISNDKELWWRCTNKSDGYDVGFDYNIVGIETGFFNRIGQYDFTKPEQPKEIKKLPNGYGDGYVLYKGVTEVDGTVENGWVSIGVLSSKINELVDAVNELRNK